MLIITETKFRSRENQEAPKHVACIHAAVLQMLASLHTLLTLAMTPAGSCCLAFVALCPLPLLCKQSLLFVQSTETLCQSLLSLCVEGGSALLQKSPQKAKLGLHCYQAYVCDACCCNLQAYGPDLKQPVQNIVQT